MKKLKSNLTNMAVVLSLIAIIAGGILAFVNSVTAPQIEKIKDETLAAGIKKVMCDDNITVTKIDTINAAIEGKMHNFVVYEVGNAEGEQGKAVKTTENGFGGAMDVLVGFDPEGTVLGYTILQHTETPGLGAKAGLWFQKEGGESRTVVGKNPSKANFTVSKDGGDIDAITASTITSRAFLKAIQNAYNQIAVQP